MRCLVLIQAAWVLFTAALPAQQAEREVVLRLSVSKRGGTRLVDLEARGASLVDVLAALAPELGRKLHIAPDALEAAQQARVQADVFRLPAAELVSYLGDVHGLACELDGGTLSLGPLPGAGPDGAVDDREAFAGYLRRRAIEAWERTFVLPGNEDPAEVHHRLGFLELKAGSWGRAASHLLDFVRLAEDPEDPRIPQALLAAGTCAFRMDDLERAHEHLKRIEGAAPGSPELYRAQLLLSRIARRRAAALPPGEEGERARLLSEARLRLDRVMDEARDPRLSSRAILLKTELLLLHGDAEEALDVLQQFDTDLQRDCYDLALQLPLFRGLVLLEAGKLELARRALKVALVRDEDPRHRLRAAHALALVFRGQGALWQALMAADDALSMDPGADRRQRLLMLRARVFEDLGVLGPAVESLQQLVETMNAEHHAAVPPSEVLDKLASLLFSAHRYDEALRHFKELVEHEGHRRRALLMLARCELRIGRPEQALEVLDRMSRDDEAAIGATTCWSLRGRVYEALGETGKAVLAYEGWREDS